MAKRYFISNVLQAMGMICLPLFVRAQDTVAIIPQPLLIQQDTGYYHFSTLSEVAAFDDFRASADLLHDHPFIHFEEIKRIKSHKKIPETGILLLTPEEGDKLADNAYRLEVTPSTIRITAHHPEAMLNGILTLMQLAYTQPQPDSARVPCLLIEDAPRFAYRGLHLDVSRHFFPLPFLKKFIDLMALYKFNNFHWHLVDGPGWRLEIKKYPELTQKAAWRTHVLWKDWWNAGRKYTEVYTPNASGGFYTQDQARELVAYAARKGINIIPEIEFPGHSEEVLAVYPQLSCTGKPYQGGALNVGKEETFTFMEDVLSEVMDIFPSPYIHIGGDEVNKEEWKNCPECQDRMKKEGLKDLDELQSYAVKRLAEFVKSKGRKPIGWDEILDGGLPAEATVMSWRGTAGGLAAAKAGHDVIMTPSDHLYFDYYQSDPATQPEAIGGYLPIDSVYAYEPVPAGLEDANVPHILGTQGNIWTEYIPTWEHAEYMAFPRALALAEVAWTAKENRNFADFQKRLQQHYRLLQRWNINYYRPSFDAAITAVYDPVKQANTIQIQSEQYHSEMHYTTDGSDPTVQSAVYSEPFRLLTTAVVKAAFFQDSVRIGRISALTADIHRGIGKKISYLNPWSENYPAEGDSALLNGQKGSVVHMDKHWQGFSTDMDVSIDFERREEIKSVSLRFMQNAGASIFIPTAVSILLSDDGKNYREVQTLTSSIPATVNRLLFKTFTFTMDPKNKKGRYLRIVAKNTPNAYLLTDEIVIY